MRRKKLLRLVALFASAAMSVTVLVGCGEQANKDDQGRTIISVGDWPTKEEELKEANAEKARFEEANPDVLIKGDNWKFDLKSFYAKAAGGQLPTLYNSNYTEVSQIIAAGYGADLTDVLSKRGYDGRFNKNVLDKIGIAHV